MIEPLRKLQTTVWRTSGARYNASRRLKRKELFSTISLALLSALSILIAVVQRIYAEPIQSVSGLDNLLTALAICMGLFILVFTLMEWGAANGVKAHILHRNAEELNFLQSKIGGVIEKGVFDQNSKLTWDELEEFRLDYEKIKNLCGENHNPIDDKFFLSTKRQSDEFRCYKINKFQSITVWLIWNVSSIWYYAVVWVIAGCAIWYALSKMHLGIVSVQHYFCVWN